VDHLVKFFGVRLRMVALIVAVGFDAYGPVPDRAGP